MKVPLINNINVYAQMQYKEFKMKEKLGMVKGYSLLAPNPLHKAKSLQVLDNVENQDIKNLRIELIKNKLKLGREISYEELEFLKEHSPEDYDKAVKVIQEREEFRREIRNYRTKEQVDRAYGFRMNGYIVAMKSAGGDDVEVIQMKAAAIRDEYSKFIGTDEYKELEDE
ncbi:MAG: hypothetical protein GX968_04785 [Tissierellia bacterium]|nr:hypothetical protein [Tissierellia bacterium]